MFFLCQYIKRVLSCFYISNRQMFQQHLLVFRKTDELSSCICSGVQSWKKKRFHLKFSALTTICHKPICNFLGLFQLCALNIQDITGWITLHPRRITGKQDFFFSCQILNVGYILFFFHLVTHQHQFIFGNLEKILLKLKRDVLSLDEGWKYIMETHSLWNFVHKATLKNDTLTAELSSTLWKVKHALNPHNIFPVISAVRAANRHMHNACC